MQVEDEDISPLGSLNSLRSGFTFSFNLFKAQCFHSSSFSNSRTRWFHFAWLIFLLIRWIILFVGDPSSLDGSSYLSAIETFILFVIKCLLVTQSSTPLIAMKVICLVTLQISPTDDSEDEPPWVVLRAFFFLNLSSCLLSFGHSNL